MARILLIANQTLGGEALDRAVEFRIEAHTKDFFVVVPMVEPEHEIFYLSPRDPMFDVPHVQGQASEKSLELARQRSEARLLAMLDRVRTFGGTAEGMIGEIDPYKAARTALDRESFAEVIVSTLPLGISRWIKMDLPSRIERLVDCPVTVVEAEPVDA